MGLVVPRKNLVVNGKQMPLPQASDRSARPPVASNVAFLRGALHESCGRIDAHTHTHTHLKLSPIRRVSSPAHHARTWGPHRMRAQYTVDRQYFDSCIVRAVRQKSFADTGGSVSWHFGHVVEDIDFDAR